MPLLFTCGNFSGIPWDVSNQKDYPRGTLCVALSFFLVGMYFSLLHRMDLVPQIELLRLSLIDRLAFLLPLISVCPDSQDSGTLYVIIDI